jgi:hypothetical protein
MTNENETKILDFIPETLRSQLEMEVLQSIEERKRLEREKKLRENELSEKEKLEQLMDSLMPEYKKQKS